MTFAHRRHLGASAVWRSAFLSVRMVRAAIRFHGRRSRIRLLNAMKDVVDALGPLMTQTHRQTIEAHVQWLLNTAKLSRATLNTMAADLARASGKTGVTSNAGWPNRTGGGGTWRPRPRSARSTASARLPGLGHPLKHALRAAADAARASGMRRCGAPAPVRRRGTRRKGHDKRASCGAAFCVRGKKQITLLAMTWIRGSRALTRLRQGLRPRLGEAGLCPEAKTARRGHRRIC